MRDFALAVCEHKLAHGPLCLLLAGQEADQHPSGGERRGSPSAPAPHLFLGGRRGVRGTRRVGGGACWLSCSAILLRSIALPREWIELLLDLVPSS